MAVKIIREVGRSPNRHVKCECLCDCGKIFIAFKSNITSGHTKSCGCLRSKNARQLFTTHGKSGARVYRIWIEMIHRCYLKSDTNYHKYGSKGITVCDEWKNDFQAFYDWAMANGYSDELTIDRIDGKGNYCPENCRWTTYQQQNKNRTFKKGKR